jgi:hypothetical protein
MSDKDDELRRKLQAALVRPTGLDAAREFLQTYVMDADLEQVERIVAHMMKTNPVTIESGADGLAAILASPQPPGTLAELVARDANRALDDPSDEAAHAWLSRLHAALERWIAAAS